MGVFNLIPSAAGDETGLTADGVAEAVSRHCEFTSPNVRDDDGDIEHRVPPEPRAHARRAVEDTLAHLMERGAASRDELIEEFFSPNPPPQPSQLRYAQHGGEAWYRDVVETALTALPCVARGDGGDTWRFTGVDTAEYDEEHLVPLEDLRADPETRAAAVLDDLGVPRRSDRRAAVLKFWRSLREQGSATAAELDGEVRGTPLSSCAAILEELPGVEREVEQPPDPEDIEIETFADVLAARDAVEKDATETWRFDAGAVDSPSSDKDP